jgi:CheY-like chemotaxis protein
MPGLSGLQVLATVRADGCQFPFVLMSGHATTADVDEARALGVSGFLSKPFSPPQLAAEVDRIKRSSTECLARRIA